MVSMVKLDAGFDPYSAYTSVLKRSAHIASDDSKVETAQKTESKGLINSSNPVEDDATKSAVASLRAEIPPVDVKDLSESLKGIQDFSFIGRNSEIKQLDANKAVSDMQKDEILSQYQYFVGDSKNEGFLGDDSIVLQKM